MAPTHIPSDTTWLPSLRVSLPHTLVHTSLDSHSATKADDAKTNLNMWDQQILPLFPSARSDHLNIIC